MKALPYEDAYAGDRALQELQRVLEGFGCESFATGVDNGRMVVVVQFRWRGRKVAMEASWKGYAAAWRRRHPWTSRMNRSQSAYDQLALDKGRVAVCSVLPDWVKAQTVALECGILQFEEVFMPHMVLSDGRRVIEVARERGALPAIEHDA